MKFCCNGTDLANAANIVSKALAPNKNIPALEGIHLNAHGEELTLSAYNQEIYIEKTIKAEVYVEGDLIVNGKILNDYANKIACMDRIEVEKQLNNKLSFVYGSSNSEINYFDVSNFPTVGQYTATEFMKIKECDLRDILESSIFCVSPNDSRPVLRSCRLSAKDGIAEAVCMDGFRIGIGQKPYVDASEGFTTIILGKIISDVAKILSDGEKTVTICKAGSSVVFDIGHTKIRTTTVDGTFYRFEGNFPRVVNNEIVVKKADLEDCLGRAAILGRDSISNNVIITVENNQFNVSASSEKGKINENLECKSTGEPLKIGLNNKFVLEAVARIKEDYLKMQIESATRPVLITRMEGDEYRCLVLPVRIV